MPKPLTIAEIISDMVHAGLPFVAEIVQIDGDTVRARRAGSVNVLVGIVLIGARVSDVAVGRSIKVEIIDGQPYGYLLSPLGEVVLPNQSVTPGTYTNSTVTVDQQGRVTYAANGGGGVGGDAISVNGNGVVDADLDDATPSAPGGTVNVKWQKDASSPANVSAYVPAATTTTPGAVELATDGESAAGLAVQANDSRLASVRVSATELMERVLLGSL